MRMYFRRAFSLVEVLIVGAIVAILAAIVFVASGPAREKARQAHCITNLRQIYQSIQMYSADHSESPRLPGTDLAIFPSVQALQAYLKDWSILYCPDFPNDRQQPWGSSYVWQIMAFRQSMRDDKAWFEDRLRDLSAKESSYPIVYCTMHDVMYYYPREADAGGHLMDPFKIELKVDGSVESGRKPGARLLPSQHPNLR